MPELDWVSEGGTRTDKRLDPMEMVSLSEVVKTKRTKITMRGRVFSLSYNREGYVYYKPVRGFVPCGYISLQRLDKYIDEMDA